MEIADKHFMETLVKKILFESFSDNQSINFVVKQGKRKEKNFKRLLSYSTFMAKKFGKIYLSIDNKVCAIVLDSSKKKMTLSRVLWEAKLAFQVIGVSNIGRILNREKLLGQFYPSNKNYIHLWYIGVDPNFQCKGLGSKMLKEIIEDNSGKDIYLETSTKRNFLFYEKHGFEVVRNFQKELGYDLNMYVLKSNK